MSKGKEDLLQEVGQRIKEVRLAADIPQKQLADEFESEQSRISKIEKGAREPGTDFYNWFANRTGCSLDYIICGKEIQRSVLTNDHSRGVDLNKALMSLMDAFIESSEFAKYMTERKLISDDLKSCQGPLTDSEIRLINALRKMDIATAFKIIEDAINHKNN